MIVCVLLARFALAVAAGGREALVSTPAALAPEPGRDPRIGEASASAEAHGVRSGMRLAEAMARCPGLRLIAPDPVGVADAHERLLERLEALGAKVEPGPPGIAFFDANGLRGLHGGTLDGVLGAVRRAVDGPIRIGVAPSRFAALAAASQARSRRVVVAAGTAEGASRGRAAREGGGAAALARWLAPQPVTLLALREETAPLVEALERFGIRTLGEVAALPRAAVADRFGPAGLRAHDLARGRDSRLRLRIPSERLEEELALPEAASGPQLERALELLIDRLLARRERRGRTLRAAVLSASLVAGGTWRVRVTFREALADPRRMRLVLASRLAELPAPAEALRLRAEGLTPAAGDQRALLDDPAVARRRRLREAIRQARSVAGPDAALRILEVDPESRVPERRLALAPWEV